MLEEILSTFMQMNLISGELAGIKPNIIQLLTSEINRPRKPSIFSFRTMSDARFRVFIISSN